MSVNGEIKRILKTFVNEKQHKIDINVYDHRGPGESTYADVTIYSMIPTSNGPRRLTLAAFKTRIAAPEYCCGAVMFEGLSWSFNEKYLKKGFKRNNAVDTCIMGVVDYLDSHWERSHFLYYVADYQTAIEDALKRCGFKEISEFYNPNSQNMVRLYELKLNQDQRYEDEYDDDEEW